MRHKGVPNRWRLILSVLTLLGATAFLVPSQAGSINWDGVWVATSYATSQGSLCNSAAGEICMELCHQTPSGLIGTRELCCVQGTTCQLRGYRR